MVFGRVLEGMDIVYKVEAEGSQSGKPKSKVGCTACCRLLYAACSRVR